MKAKKIISILDNFAPTALIDSWDNTGFQVGDDSIDIKKVLLSLDVDERVIDYSIEKNVDMIISHHPVIFRPIEEINTRSEKGRTIYKAIKEDIVIYNAHSNLDQAVGGVSDVLADKFMLRDREILSENLELDKYVYGYGRVGYIDRMDLVDFISLTKEILDLDKLTVYGDVNKRVERIALCGGSGSSFIKDAYDKQADVYITGDIKYHDAQEGTSLGMTIIDAGHYHTEKFVLEKLKEVLNKELGNALDIEVYEKSSPIYNIY